MYIIMRSFPSSCKKAHAMTGTVDAYMQATPATPPAMSRREAADRASQIPGSPFYAGEVPPVGMTHPGEEQSGGLPEPIPRRPAPSPTRHAWPHQAATPGGSYYHHEHHPHQQQQHPPAPPVGGSTPQGFSHMNHRYPPMPYHHQPPPTPTYHPPPYQGPASPGHDYYSHQPAYYAGHSPHPGYYPPTGSQADYHHSMVPPPPSLQQQHQHQQPYLAQAAYSQHSHGMGNYPGTTPSYLQTPTRESIYAYPKDIPLPSSSFSVDSRSTLGISDPTHLGLPSIANTSSMSPTPPPVPPSTAHPVKAHPISAPNSLDEAEGGVAGGPLQQQANVLNSHHSTQAVSSVPKEMGSSEKRETLDTASVLLAFSSAHQRPASTTSTIDDTDTLSLATISTLPHSVAPPEPVLPSLPPADYPKRLARPEDKDCLNQLHCYIRSELLELVVIQPADGKTGKETDSFNKVPTSSDPLQIGRVGLRCIHCSMSPDGGRTGPSMSIFYPKSLGEIYRLVTSWKRCHLSKCGNVPKSVRDELGRLSSVKARGKTSYWSDSAAQLGLVNVPSKIGGICFSTASCTSSAARGLTPVQLTVTMTASEHAHSPESIPTISDASTFVSHATKTDTTKPAEQAQEEDPTKTTSVGV